MRQCEKSERVVVCTVGVVRWWCERLEREEMKTLERGGVPWRVGSHGGWGPMEGEQVVGSRWGVPVGGHTDVGEGGRGLAVVPFIAQRVRDLPKMGWDWHQMR
jgi:hypothetical protein